MRNSPQDVSSTRLSPAPPHHSHCHPLRSRRSPCMQWSARGSVLHATSPAGYISALRLAACTREAWDHLRRSQARCCNHKQSLRKKAEKSQKQRQNAGEPLRFEVLACRDVLHSEQFLSFPLNLHQPGVTSTFSFDLQKMFVCIPGAHAAG